MKTLTDIIVTVLVVATLWLAFELLFAGLDKVYGAPASNACFSACCCRYQGDCKTAGCECRSAIQESTR